MQDKKFSRSIQQKFVTLPKVTCHTQVGLDIHFINRRLTDKPRSYHSAITFHVAISSPSLPWVLKGLIQQAVMGRQLGVLYGCCPRNTAQGLIRRQELNLNCLFEGLGEKTVGLNRRRKMLRGRSDKNNRQTQSPLSEFSSLGRRPAGTSSVLTPPERIGVEHAYGTASHGQVSAFKGCAALPGR